MNNRDQLLRDLTACAAPLRVMEIVTALCLAPRADDGQEVDPRADELLRDAERLKADLKIVFSAEVRRELIAFIKYLDKNREFYRKSLLLWLDLIEEVCYLAEKDLGDETGTVKFRRVRGAVSYLLSKFTQGLEVPGVPRYLTHFFIDFAIRGTIEFVITLVNTGKFEPRPPLTAMALESRGLWDNALQQESLEAASVAQKKVGPLERAQNRVSLWQKNFIVFFLKLWEPLINRVLNWILDKLLAPPSVPEEFKHKVDAIITDMNLIAPGMPPARLMADWFLDVIKWVGRHGKELRAGIDALTIAIHWTAKLSDLSRNERLNVIEDALIIYFDEELGLRGPFFRLMLRFLIDINVSAIEFLYEKRQVVPPPAPAQ
jgi:hypothetical protein